MFVVFDVDDTMYDLMWPFQMAFEKILVGKTDVSCEELFCQSRICSDIVLEKEKRGLILPEDAFFRRMQMTCEEKGFGITREESEAFEREYRYHQTKIVLFDFMQEILDYCRKQEIPRAVLTNGSRKSQGRKLEVLQMTQWFDEDKLFISGEIGYHKPDVHAFQYIQNRLGARGEDVWYIGDTYENDIVGANRAGWNSIWLNHRKRPCPDAVSLADVELENGWELLSVIQRLSIR